jgi:hypothetical protein
LRARDRAGAAGPGSQPAAPVARPGGAYRLAHSRPVTFPKPFTWSNASGSRIGRVRW